jgi:hypothetical protein
VGFRSLLQTKYAEGMEGCILIGDLPIPWYETDFGDPPEHAEFPIDLFYMDMDGLFDDTDSDGMYDAHFGDVAPEIWVGRLTASPMTLGDATEVSLIENYFRKDHLYRCGLMPVESRSLVYVDDDWVYWSGWWNQNVGTSYNDRTFVNDEWITWSPDYEMRLPESYEFIQVCVHSWPGGHGFKDPNEQWSWTYNSEIRDIQPTAHFYNLFACSNARYVEPDYCSGWYIFGQDCGLVAIGSAKSGSMLAFEDFYEPFGDGKEIGRAFLDWFAARAEGGFDEGEITWHYGMTLHGDPTLTIQKKSNAGLLRFDDGTAAFMINQHETSGWDLHNVRFTTSEPCTLAGVSVTGQFVGSADVRMYIWNSDGTYPTDVIDSLDVPTGGLSNIDLLDKNLIFGENFDIHVGFQLLNPAPGDTIWFYMDDGVQCPEPRSGAFTGEGWQTLSEAYGQNYNYLIRAEVRYDEEPQVIITTTSIPDAIVGEVYSGPIEAIGGSGSYNWEITAGGLPDGLILEPTTGLLSGVPLNAGTYNFSVRAIDINDPALSDVQHLNATFTIVCGDANSDAQVNVADAVFIINYVFKGGPAPGEPDAANSNCDTGVDVADAVYLINYVFKGGAAPCCP